MRFVLTPPRVPSSGASRAGFSLIELLVALSIIGVASTIFIQMYTISMDLGKLSRNRQVAVSVAGEQLNRLVMEPAAYVWETAEAGEDGVFRIRTEASEPRAGESPDTPSVMPFEDSARRHQQNVYDQFRWRAFGKLGERGLFYEVFVDVYWEQAGRERHITLTGAVARSQVEPRWWEDTP